MNLDGLLVQARGVLFDLPHVIKDAEKIVSSMPHADRIAFDSGDFFDASTITKDGAAYLLAYLLHDWTDDDCEKILRNIAEVMAPDGCIVLVEQVRSMLSGGACNLFGLTCKLLEMADCCDEPCAALQTLRHVSGALCWSGKCAFSFVTAGGLLLRFVHKKRFSIVGTDRNVFKDHCSKPLQQQR